MSHKIAIITTRDIFSNYGEDHSVIVDSISDWQEVSHEDYALLCKAQARTYGAFHIIEQPTDTPKFIARTIADYLKLAAEDEKKAAEGKVKREKASIERKHKKELKDKESKLKLLKQLQEELGNQV